MPGNILEPFRNIKNLIGRKSYLKADIRVTPDIEIIDYGKQTKKPLKMGD